MPALFICDETLDQSPVAAAFRMLVAVSTLTVPLCMPLASAVAALRPASPISMPMLSSVVMMLCEVPSHDATSCVSCWSLRLRKDSTDTPALLRSVAKSLMSPPTAFMAVETVELDSTRFCMLSALPSVIAACAVIDDETLLMEVLQASRAA